MSTTVKVTTDMNTAKSAAVLRTCQSIQTTHTHTHTCAHARAPAMIFLLLIQQAISVNRFISLHCALSLAAQCIVIGPVCVRVCKGRAACVCLCICGSVTTITRNCVHPNPNPHQTGFVSKRSDHFQLIKFWPSCGPGKGVCGRAKIFGSALLQPARSVCVSLGAFFIDSVSCQRQRTRITEHQLFGCNTPWTLNRFTNSPVETFQH